MIVVRIFGGLGNQMFQYAAGRALAAHLDAPLKLDLRWLKRYHTPFQMSLFNLPVKVSSRYDDLRFTWFPFKRNPFLFYIKCIRYLNNSIYMEQSLQYKSDFWSLGVDRFLFGYFQSEKYFKDFEPLIRQDFNYQPDLSIYDTDVIEALQSTGVTAIQFRRGDYVTNLATNRSIGVCTMDYYERAINHITSQGNPVRFLVFSDDIEWCRQNVKLGGAVYVERMGGSPLDDMFLAARCKNIILANSTFSWWCAWLNQNPDKIVIAPKIWFRDSVLQEQSHDLIPDSWIRL